MYIFSWPKICEIKHYRSCLPDAKLWYAPVTVNIKRPSDQSPSSGPKGLQWADRGKNKRMSAKDLITDYNYVPEYEADFVIYLGSSSVSAYMSRCRGQFVHIPWKSAKNVCILGHNHLKKALYNYICSIYFNSPNVSS